jgi:hypothetical protein
VRATFFTPTGERVRANLADIAVPAGENTEIALNRFIRLQPIVSVEIEAVRGRVVAWRSIVIKRRDGPTGLASSLGATSPSVTWYFAAGEVGDSAEDRITILNPSNDEAVVTVSLSTADKPIQPQSLVEVSIPPRTSKRLSLSDATKGLRAGVSAVVTSTNGVPLVAEQSLAISNRGVSAEVGLTRAAEEWLVGPAALRPSDDSVAVMNPSSQTAHVSMTLLYEHGAPRRPAALQRIAIPAGLRREIALDRWTTGQVSYVRIRSASPIVAERVAFSGAAGDLADVAGVPLRPSER